MKLKTLLNEAKKDVEIEIGNFLVGKDHRGTNGKALYYTQKKNKTKQYERNFNSFYIKTLIIIKQEIDDSRVIPRILNKVEQLKESKMNEFSKVRPGESAEINKSERKNFKAKLKMSDAEVKGTFKLLSRPSFGTVKVRSNVTNKVYSNLADEDFNPAHIKNYIASFKR